MKPTPMTTDEQINTNRIAARIVAHIKWHTYDERKSSETMEACIPAIERILCEELAKSIVASAVEDPECILILPEDLGLDQEDEYDCDDRARYEQFLKTGDW